jgi:hypothetical protein
MRAKQPAMLLAQNRDNIFYYSLIHLCCKRFATGTAKYDECASGTVLRPLDEPATNGEKVAQLVVTL